MALTVVKGADVALRPLRDGKALQPSKPRYWRGVDLAPHLHVVDENEHGRVLRNFMPVSFAAQRLWGTLISILERQGDLDDCEVYDEDGLTHRVRRLKYGSPRHLAMLRDVANKTRFLEQHDYAEVRSWFGEDMLTFSIESTKPLTNELKMDSAASAAKGNLGVIAGMCPVSASKFLAMRDEVVEVKAAVSRLRDDVDDLRGDHDELREEFDEHREAMRLQGEVVRSEMGLLRQATERAQSTAVDGASVAAAAAAAQMAADSARAVADEAAMFTMQQGVHLQQQRTQLGNLFGGQSALQQQSQSHAEAIGNLFGGQSALQQQSQSHAEAIGSLIGGQAALQQQSQGHSTAIGSLIGGQAALRTDVTRLRDEMDIANTFLRNANEPEFNSPMALPVQSEAPPPRRSSGKMPRWLAQAAAMLSTSPPRGSTDALRTITNATARATPKSVAKSPRPVRV